MLHRGNKCGLCCVVHTNNPTSFAPWAWAMRLSRSHKAHLGPGLCDLQQQDNIVLHPWSQLLCIFEWIDEPKLIIPAHCTFASRKSRPLAFKAARRGGGEQDILEAEKKPMLLSSLTHPCFTAHSNRYIYYSTSFLSTTTHSH